jgi:hypothetical protein
LILFSCKKEVPELHIEYNDGSYYDIKTNDGRILFSFIYNEHYASFPVRIIVPNFDLDYPIMIYFEFDEELNIRNYKVSDGKFYEDLVSVLLEQEIYVTHRLRVKNNQIIYSIKNDGNIDITDKSNIGDAGVTDTKLEERR